MNSNLVLFDTNVLERKYMYPLLRGEKIRDFEMLEAMNPPLTPAVSIKTIYEILTHIKLGNKPFSWLSTDTGYPGGIKSRTSFSSHFDVDHAFYRCEEWHDLDWDEELERARSVVVESDQAALQADFKMQREFLEWKRELIGFCIKVRNLLEDRMKIIYRHDTYGTDLRKLNATKQLEDELSLHSIIPNEDLEIVVAALSSDCIAMVTDEKDILNYASKTTNDNYRTCFIHSSRLADAVALNFSSRLLLQLKS